MVPPSCRARETGTPRRRGLAPAAEAQRVEVEGRVIEGAGDDQDRQMTVADREEPPAPRTLALARRVGDRSAILTHGALAMSASRGWPVPNRSRVMVLTRTTVRWPEQMAWSTVFAVETPVMDPQPATPQWRPPACRTAQSPGPAVPSALSAGPGPSASPACVAPRRRTAGCGPS